MLLFEVPDRLLLAHLYLKGTLMAATHLDKRSDFFLPIYDVKNRHPAKNIYSNTYRGHSQKSKSKKNNQNLNGDGYPAKTIYASTYKKSDPQNLPTLSKRLKSRTAIALRSSNDQNDGKNNTERKSTAHISKDKEKTLEKENHSDQHQEDIKNNSDVDEQEHDTIKSLQETDKKNNNESHVDKDNENSKPSSSDVHQHHEMKQEENLHNTTKQSPSENEMEKKSEISLKEDDDPSIEFTSDPTKKEKETGDQHSLAEKPKSVNFALMLLWISLLASTIKLMMDFIFTKGNFLALLAISNVISVLMVVASAYLILQISAGKNWARILFLVISVLGIIPNIPRFTEESLHAFSANILSIGQLLIRGYGLYLLFTPPASTWFGSPLTTAYTAEE